METVTSEEMSAARHQLGEGLARDELGDDVAIAGVDAVVEDLEDVVVSEVLNGPRLSGEPLAVACRGGKMGMENLDGHVSAQRGMAATVDGRHAAFTDLLKHLVLIELRTNHGRPRLKADLSLSYTSQTWSGRSPACTCVLLSCVAVVHQVDPS